MKTKEKHTNLSQFISLILRHKPEVIGLRLDKDGYVEVEALIHGINTHNGYIDEKMLDEIVETDDKKRYSYNLDKTKIRANQGHSIKVDLDLKEKTPPDILFHGTSERFIKRIYEEGIKKMDREWVHLSATEELAMQVGGRHGSPVVIKVDARRMNLEGFLFYLSENGVWLSENIPARYLEKPLKEKHNLRSLIKQ